MKGRRRASGKTLAQRVHRIERLLLDLTQRVIRVENTAMRWRTRLSNHTSKTQGKRGA
jgi:hypothetical protein